MKVILGIIVGFVCSGWLVAYGPCDKDAEKLCHHSEETVKNCLHQKVDKLSKACRQWVESQKKDWDKKNKQLSAVKKNCQAEVTKHCPEAAKSHKPFLVCMMSHGETLSPSCRDAANGYIKEFLPNIKQISR